MNVSPRLTPLFALVLAAISSPLWAQDYRAPLQPVNPLITGPGLSGIVRLVQRGDELEISIEAKGLAPGMMHMQHLHGSRDGMDASCAPMVTKPGADEVTDILDTRQYSGIILIPLHNDPVSLEIKTDTYPVSNRAGGYSYKKTINWPALQQAVADEYGIEDVELWRMVLYIHRVPRDTDLPASAGSLDGLPARMTLPVACGQLDIQPTQH